MSGQTPEALQLVKMLVQQPGNNICADCQREVSKWASSTLGIFICYNCSGIHRALGTHITLVRSCTLDGWTPQQAKVMKRVGNKIANEYWEANLPPDFMRPLPTDRYNMERFIRDKYERRLWAADGEPPHLRKPGFAKPAGSTQQIILVPQQMMQMAPASEPPAHIHINTSPSPSPISAEKPEKPVKAFKFTSEKKSGGRPKFARPITASQSESLENLQKHDIAPDPSDLQPQDTTQAENTQEQEPERELEGFSFEPENPAPKKQSLFGNTKKKSTAKGVARFAKKPTGDAVINQMISSPESRPMTAPVQPNKNAALSLFAGMNVFPTKV